MPPPGMAPYQPVMAYGPQEKSSGIALLLGILWPGAGHVYLGLTKKGLPYLIANIVGIVLTLLFIPLILVHLVIWLITLLMTVGSIESDVSMVNDAIRRGYRIDG